MERNTCRNPWQNLFNVSLRQSLPEFNGNRFAVQLDIFNFLNFLNKDWGVNQGAILIGYWWASLLTREMWQLSLGFAVPALAGVVAGALMFERVDQRRFRQLVFALIFVSGLVLLVRG